MKNAAKMETFQFKRKQVNNGINPAVAKKAHTTAGKERAANRFEVIAREWLDISKTCSAENHHKVLIVRMEKDVFPYIGNKPIAEISALEVLSICRRVESLKKKGDGLYAVGGTAGLYLQIVGNSKLWILRATIAGRRRDIGLGSYE